jgi:hypothetical protein
LSAPILGIVPYNPDPDDIRAIVATLDAYNKREARLRTLRRTRRQTRRHSALFPEEAFLRLLAGAAGMIP